MKKVGFPYIIKSLFFFVLVLMNCFKFGIYESFPFVENWKQDFNNIFI